MSLYHFSVKQVSRGKGQSVLNSAAYISGQKLHSDYYGQTYDYTKKKGVLHTEIMFPDYVPESFSDRETLWDQVEFAERGKKAQLAYSFDIALQNELTIEENIELAREFCREQFVERGMIVDIAVHEGHSDDPELADNPHFHVLVPIRPIKEDGTWGNKQRRVYQLDEEGNRVRGSDGKYIFKAVSTTGWNSPELLEEWRKEWAEKVNAKFKANGLAARIDHRSFVKQGIDLIPTVHEGYEVRAMEKKGIHTIVGDLNREIRFLNRLWIQIKESLQWAKTFREEVSAEIYRRKNPTIIDSLREYYDRRDLVADTFRYGSRKAHLTNLKEFSEVISYLTANQITTIEQLNGRIEELHIVVDGMRAETKSRRAEISRYRELLDYDRKMKKLQPVIEKYNRIFFKSSKKKYYGEHKKEIDLYRMCDRRLRPYRDENGKLPLSQWKGQQVKLSGLNEEADMEIAPYEEELEMVRKVRKCIDIVQDDKMQSQPDSADSAGRAEEKPQPTQQQKGSVLDKLNRNKEKLREQEERKTARKKARRNEVSL